MANHSPVSGGVTIWSWPAGGCPPLPPTLPSSLRRDTKSRSHHPEGAALTFQEEKLIFMYSEGLVVPAGGRAGEAEVRW